MKSCFKTLTKGITAALAALALSSPVSATVIAYDFDVIVAYEYPCDCNPHMGGGGKVAFDTDLLAITDVDIITEEFTINWTGVALGELFLSSPDDPFEYQSGVLKFDGPGQPFSEWYLSFYWPVAETPLAHLHDQVSEKWVYYIDDEREYMAYGQFSNPVPEPSVFALLGLGLIGLCLSRRRA